MQIHLKTAEEVSKFWHEKITIFTYNFHDNSIVYRDVKIRAVESSGEIVRAYSGRLAKTWQILEVTRL